MAKIILMDPHLANLIAAGEVIERPSSVIKELVENSIDAHAKHIEVSLKSAGKELITVKDDGDGMDRDDAVACFKRHASSKLYDEYQLFKIKTMGFRGEALPSISAVSVVTLYTSTGEGVGSKVIAQEGKIERVDYAARKGSIFEVKELFYNTPVRLKYLKTDYTEVASCLEVMQRLALAHPNIAFDFINDGKISFSTTGRGDLLEVISRLYGVDTAKRMIPVSFESLEYQVKGYIGKPELTRATRYFTITILNKRNVYLPKIQKAIIDAYKDYIFSSQFPFVVLDISAEISLVDVNVHPTKKEVRLSSEEILIRIVKEGIIEKLKELNAIHSNPQLSKMVKEEDKVSLVKDSPFSDIEIFRPRTMSQVPNQDTYIIRDQDSKEVPLYIKEPNSEATSVPSSKVEQIVKEKVIPEFKVVGQLLKTYIIYETREGFYMMDQHAAMERINYEKFQKLYNSSYDIVEPLIPLTIDLSLAEMNRFTLEKKQALKEIGIVAEEFGPTSIRIISYPTFIDEKNNQNTYLQSIFMDALSDTKVDIKELRRHVIATMACRASLKANDELSVIEMESLFKRLFSCDNPTCCPHGRPTIILFTKYDIEKIFKRSGL